VIVASPILVVVVMNADCPWGLEVVVVLRDGLVWKTTDVVVATARIPAISKPAAKKYVFNCTHPYPVAPYSCCVTRRTDPDGQDTCTSLEGQKSRPLQLRDDTEESTWHPGRTLIDLTVQIAVPAPACPHTPKLRERRRIPASATACAFR
jgi:hypothetical protein